MRTGILLSFKLGRKVFLLRSKNDQRSFLKASDYHDAFLPELGKFSFCGARTTRGRSWKRRIITTLFCRSSRFLTVRRIALALEKTVCYSGSR